MEGKRVSNVSDHTIRETWENFQHGCFIKILKFEDFCLVLGNP
jgi:hypothetical protein